MPSPDDLYANSLLSTLIAYKLRVQIAKALNTRSRAVRTALDNYNRQARTLEPPRPPLDFSEVIEYSSLAEFDLLRDTSSNVQSRVWAQPAYRGAMGLYFKMKCAREELKRLNIEITRLRTSIRDDSALHILTIKTLELQNPGLAAVLSHNWKLRDQVNYVHLARLDNLALLSGYTGSRDCGTRKGFSTVGIVAQPSGEPSAPSRSCRLDGANESDDDDEAREDMIDTFANFASHVE